MLWMTGRVDIWSFGVFGFIGCFNQLKMAFCVIDKTNNPFKIYNISHQPLLQSSHFSENQIFMTNPPRTLCIMDIIYISALIITTTQSNKDNQRQPLYKFTHKSHMTPHPSKAHRGGQDAFYSGDNLLVIADGVGGWNSQGVDPSRYSRFLCRAQVYYNEDPQFYDQNPIELIVKAQEKNNYIGSATMVVLTVDREQLRSCYIGGGEDSGFVVIRVFDEKPLVIYQFSQQQHAFNFPYQLAMKKYNGDDPRRSICVSVDIREGDIVVVGSDGLFDNVFVDEILATVEDAIAEGGEALFDLPRLFAEEAISRGQNDTFSSPFSQRAQDLGIDFQGGKLDDTTVIVARIDKVEKVEIVQTVEQL